MERLQKGCRMCSFRFSVTPPEQDCSGLAVALRHFSVVHHVGLHCSSQVLMSQYCGQVCARYPRSTDGEYVAEPRCGNYTLLPRSSRDRRNSGVFFFGPARLHAMLDRLFLHSQKTLINIIVLNSEKNFFET